MRTLIPVVALKEGDIVVDLVGYSVEEQWRARAVVLTHHRGPYLDVVFADGSEETHYRDGMIYVSHKELE